MLTVLVGYAVVLLHPAANALFAFGDLNEYGYAVFFVEISVFGSFFLRKKSLLPRI